MCVCSIKQCKSQEREFQTLTQVLRWDVRNTIDEIRHGDWNVPIYIYRVFQKWFYNGIPNATVWRVLGKHLHLRRSKLSIA
jgi:hypothetical protein